MIKKSVKRFWKRLLTSQKTAPKAANDLILPRNRWLDCLLVELSPAQIIEGAIALDQDADESWKQNRDAYEVGLRVRAIELIEAKFTVSQKQPLWIDNFYAKQLRQGALACDRLAGDQARAPIKDV